MSDKNLRITEDHAGRRLDNFLFNVYKSLPKSKIYNMIRKGEIRVNSGRIKPSRKLHLDDEIRIPPYLINFDENEVIIKIPPSRIKEYWKSILFENNDYIVFNKDPELSVHSGSNNQFGLIDISRAAHESDEIDLCHRIDKSTSGCIVLAKNKKFLRNFHTQLKIFPHEAKEVKGHPGPGPVPGWRAGTSSPTPHPPQMKVSREGKVNKLRSRVVCQDLTCSVSVLGL